MKRLNDYSKAEQLNKEFRIRYLAKVIRQWRYIAIIQRKARNRINEALQRYEKKNAHGFYILKYF